MNVVVNTKIIRKKNGQTTWKFSWLPQEHEKTFIPIKKVGERLLEKTETEIEIEEYYLGIIPNENEQVYVLDEEGRTPEKIKTLKGEFTFEEFEIAGRKVLLYTKEK